MSFQEKPKCYLASCDLPSRGRIGLCNKHYRKKLKYGDPSVVVCDTGKPPLHTVHGRSSTKYSPKDRTYNSWTSMHWRCSTNTPKIKRIYKDKYISVCERWRSFELFLEDMGDRPEGTSLDRIDGTKGYSPENCRWADLLTQSRNTSQIKLKFNDALAISFLHLKGKTMSQIAKKLGQPYVRVYQICKRGKWQDAYEMAIAITIGTGI